MNIELYKRNANDNISVWIIDKGVNNKGVIVYGILGKKLHHENLLTNRDIDAEIASRVAAKRKEGYKSIEDVYDNSPIDTTKLTLGEKIHYLTTYLPKFNTTSDGFILPMLAKTHGQPHSKIINLLISMVVCLDNIRLTVFDVL